MWAAFSMATGTTGRTPSPLWPDCGAARGDRPHELPDLWGMTGTDTLYAEAPDWGERRMEQAEQALHIAVTLWALHQQSHRSAAMHITGGPELGVAVRRLMPDSGAFDDRILRRFVRTATASSLPVLAQRLRDLVLLLRQADIPLDYGLLADQLYQWQQPAGPAAVHRAWGRAFHAYRPPAPATSKTPTTPDTAPDSDKDAQ